MPTVSFTGVKSCTASGDSIDVVFTTRYSGDLSVTMTRGCLGELVTALAGNAGEASAAAAEAKAAAAETKGKRGRAAAAPVATPAPAATALAPAPAVNAPEAGTADSVAVRVPKRWSVAAETKIHNVVLLFFDPQTEKQSSFALSPKAAAEMASALVEKGKVVASNVATRKDPAKP